VWGGLTDRFSRSRLVLPTAALVATAGATALVSAAGLPAIVASVFVLSIGLSGIGPILDAGTLEILGADRIRYGQLRAWGSLAFVVTAWIAGGLIDARGDAALFVVYIPALAATALIALSLPRRGVTRQVSILRGARSFVLAPGMRLFLLGSVFVWSMFNAVNSFYSIQIVALGAPATTVGLAWAVGAIVEVPIMFGYPRLAARFGAGPLLILGAAAFALRAAAAAVATNATMLVLITPLEGLGFGLFFVGGVNFVAHRAPAGLSATAQGVYAASSGLAAIVGAGFGGFVAGALTIPGLFAASAVCGALAALVIAVAVRTPGSATDETGGATREAGGQRDRRPAEATAGLPGRLEIRQEGAYR
jgi:PPP family 3-phenylpropionic acid transporter